MRLRSTLFAAVAAALASSGASAQTTVTTPVVANKAAYRLLAAPVAGQTVANIASQNLVQGITGQYPQAPGPNIFTFYDNAAGGGGTAAAIFRAPASTASSLRQGAGFFWYFYDRDIPANAGGPFGGGTSSSRELTGFTLSATGTAATANVLTQFTPNPDGAYMMGNPFAQPFTLSGISASSGTLGTVFQVFDPTVGSAGSYVPLNSTASVAPWQGFFGTVTGATAGQVLGVTYAFASVSPSATPPFYGKQAAEQEIKFRLDGMMAAGTTGDVAAQVRFVEGASVGQDLHDSPKLLPPGGPFALIASVGERDSAPARLAVNSFPTSLTDVTVPLAFAATDAGTFTLTWENTLAPGHTAMLRDLARNATVSLNTATEYTFASDATDWTTRFELVIARSAVAGEAGPAAVRVGAFAPNPAAGTSRLAFTADAAQTVRATVVDALGREVLVLFDGAVTAGAETPLVVEAGRLAPGTYAVRIAGETFAQTRRLTVVR